MTLDEYRRCKRDWRHYHDSDLSRKEMAKLIVNANDVADEWCRITAKEYGRARRLEDENDKLRELARAALRTMTSPNCGECANEHSCKTHQLSECVEVTDLRHAARELGIEVEL